MKRTRKKRAEKQTDQEMQPQQSQEQQVVVDPQTFLSLQISKFDEEIAAAEIVVAQAKHRKAKAILDFGVNQVEQQQAAQAAKVKATSEVKDKQD